MTVRCGREVRCWACSITKETRSRYYAYIRGEQRNLTSWELYERAVEAIEAMGPRLWRIVDVWHKAGGGPAMHNYARHAVRDMMLHGLVVCAAHSSDGKCSQWTIKEAR